MTAKDLFDGANRAFKDSDYAAALKAYRAALELEPEKAAWHAALGACLLRMNEAPAAVAAYENALLLAPDEAKFHVGLAQALLRTEKFERASAALKRAIALKPDVARWHGSLGSCLMRLNDPVGAKAAYLTALALEPHNSAFHIGLARVHFTIDDFEGAKEAFEAALALEPDSLSAHLGLATLAERRDDRAAAILHRRQAIALKPDQAAWHVNLARHLVQAGKPDEAVESLQAALKLEPGNTAWIAMLKELQSWDGQGDWDARDASAAYYDAIYSSSETYAREAEDTIYAPIWTRIRDLIFASQAKTVLDVGCGPGQFASLLCQQTDIVYRGFDFSQVAIHKARARGISNARFDCEDARSSGAFDGDRPDVIVCTEVLEHVSDDLGLLCRFSEGSLCICSVPSFYSFSHLRYFADSEQVRQRYSHLFASLTVEAFELPGTAHQIFLFYGRKMPSQQAVAQVADVSIAPEFPTVAMIVWNTFDSDSRVQKEIATLNANGYRVHVFCRRGDPLGPVTEQHGPGLVVERFPRQTGRDRMGAAAFVAERRRSRVKQILHMARQLLVQQQMVRAIIALRPALIHAHDLNTLIPALQAAGRAQVPLIYDAHEFNMDRVGIQNWLRPVFRRLEALALKRAAGVIVPSPGIARALARFYRVPRPTVLENWPLLDETLRPAIPDLRARLGIAENRPVALYQGGLQPHRGLMLLIEAAAEVPELDLVLMGDGRLRTELTKKIVDLGLGGRVHLLAPEPLVTLLPLTMTADFGVHPLEGGCLNHHQASPNKLYEYLHAELPVVVTDLPGMRRRLADAPGGDPSLRFAPGDKAGLIVALRHLATDEVLRANLTHSAREARRSYCWQAQEKTLKDLYRRVLPP